MSDTVSIAKVGSIKRVKPTDDACAEGDARRRRRAAGEDPAKRKQIIEGGKRVFLRMGFDAASMNDITREAGVSKGTIYVYFANKEELFEAIIEDERTAIFDDMYSALERGTDPRSVLVDFGVRLVSKITSKKVIMAQRTVIGVAERNPGLGTRFYERGPKAGHDKLIVFLQRAVQLGYFEFDDIDLATYQVGDLMSGYLLRQCLFGYRDTAPTPEEIDRTVKAGVEVFLRAYGTPLLFERERLCGAH